MDCIIAFSNCSFYMVSGVLMCDSAPMLAACNKAAVNAFPLNGVGCCHETFHVLHTLYIFWTMSFIAVVSRVFCVYHGRALCGHSAHAQPEEVKYVQIKFVISDKLT